MNFAKGALTRYGPTFQTVTLAHARTTARSYNPGCASTHPVWALPRSLATTGGIIGYIVKEGDELWNLAKYYGTTKEGIMDINHMESEQLKCGDKLLIFKENASIL